MFFAIDFYVDDASGYPYAYTLYGPAGTARPANPEDRPETQFVGDSNWATMAAWCAHRGIGPFDSDYVETEIAANDAMELKLRWDDPNLKHGFESP